MAVVPWLRDVRAVFFDAVGTVIHPDPPAAAVYAAIGRRYGSRLTDAEIRARFGAAFRREEAHDQAADLRTDETREAKRWRNIVAAVLDDVEDVSACFAALWTHFSHPSSWRCEPDAAVVLQWLREAGYPIGLASNFDARLRSVVTGLPELGGIEPLVISSEVGWRKPAPEFFAVVGRAVGLRPEQILLVGDDRDNDFAGATAAGLRAVLFDPMGRHAETVSARVSRLSDLLS